MRKINPILIVFTIFSFGMIFLIFSNKEKPRNPVFELTGDNEIEFKKWFFTNYQQGARDFYLPFEECNITVQCALYSEFLDANGYRVQPVFYPNKLKWNFRINNDVDGSGKYNSRNEAMVSGIMKSDSLLNEK